MCGIYIHIPFCRSRCVYCDFYSVTQSGQWMEAYVDALCREMRCRRDEAGCRTINTLYIGGGTPSQLPPALMCRLMAEVNRLFALAEDAEVTVEANPDDVTPAWLDAILATPVNRISMGVQTFHDPLLRLLRRRHTGLQAQDAVTRCREAGLHNISVDLIFGLPGQTLDMWRSDVEQVLQCQVPHLSAYALQYEAGTRLWSLREQGLVEEASESLSVEMFTVLTQMARQAGMEHYEISNYAMPGMRSRHNSSYWTQVPYLGFGPGAHSYDGDRMRRWNEHGLRAYVEAIGDVPHGKEYLTQEQKYNETVMTRLRTCEGLTLDILSSDERNHCLRAAQAYLRTGNLVRRGQSLCLSERAFFISDTIICDLMQ